MTLKRPETSVIKASAITTVGQFLSPGAELMRIVPTGQKLKIKAYLPNRHIGFVEAGQEEVIKVARRPTAVSSSRARSWAALLTHLSA